MPCKIKPRSRHHRKYASNLLVDAMQYQAKTRRHHFKYAPNLRLHAMQHQAKRLPSP
jgi:hypothetical protein